MTLTEIFSQGVLGVVTGILTTAFLFLCKVLWDKAVEPRIRELLYRGVDISGQWYGNEGDGETIVSEITVLIRQRAHAVTGTLRLQHTTEEKSFDLNFDLSGYLWEGYTTLNLRPTDRRVTSYATGLFKINNGGIALVGELAYRNTQHDRVETLSVILARGDAAGIRQAQLAYARREREGQYAVDTKIEPNLPDAMGGPISGQRTLGETFAEEARE